MSISEPGRSPIGGIASLFREEDGLIILDEQCRVRLMDHRARSLLDGTVGMGDAAGWVAAAVSVRLEGLPASAAPTTARGEEPQQLVVELRSVRAQVDGEPGWAVSVADVSRRRAVPDRVSEVLSVAAHELRTPLSGIIGYADVLVNGSDGVSDAERSSYERIILRQALRLKDMIDDLGMLTATSETLAVRAEPVRLGSITDGVLEALHGLAGAVEVTGDTDVVVHVDPRHLERILTNLLTNALKYGRAPIVLEHERTATHGSVRVLDHGVGVPPGFEQRMWQPFERARSEDRHVGASGAGLGLAVVAGLARANGGRCWYETGRPEGACFGIAFPRAADVAGTSDRTPDPLSVRRR